MESNFVRTCAFLFHVYGIVGLQALSVLLKLTRLNLTNLFFFFFNLEYNMLLILQLRYLQNANKLSFDVIELS